MKKVISIILALVMVMSITNVAFADETNGYEYIGLSTKITPADYKETMDVMEYDATSGFVWDGALKDIKIFPSNVTFTATNNGSEYPVYVYLDIYRVNEINGYMITYDGVNWEKWPYISGYDDNGNEILCDVTGKYVEDGGDNVLTQKQYISNYDECKPDTASEFVWMNFPDASIFENCPYVLLGKGKSVTFGIPKEEPTGTDIIYTLKAEYYDSEADYYWHSYINFIVDDALYTSLKNTDTVEGLKFTDVKNTDYFAEAVKWAVEKGITNGTSETTFSPYATCTRGQLMTVFWRAAGSPEPKSNVNPFTDVRSTAYYYKAVQWAVENGITNGTSATTFSPDATCTQAQALTLLWRYAGSPIIEDISSLSEKHNGTWFKDAIAWADLAGILNDASTLSPYTACPRADMVTYLWRNNKTVNSEYSKYDQTVLTGAEVIKSIEALKDNNIAVLVSTLGWQHEKNEGADVVDNHPVGAYADNSYSDGILDVKGGSLSFLAYYNLPENVGRTSKIYFDKDCYRSENGLKTYRNTDTSKLYVAEHKEFIPSGAQYKCYLLKDLDNNIIGVTFQGIKS